MIDENILQLEITINDVVVVQEADGVADLGAVEAGLVFTEASLASQMKEQLAAAHVLHHEAQKVASLKRVDELGGKRILERAHHHVL